MWMHSSYKVHTIDIISIKNKKEHLKSVAHMFLLNIAIQIINGIHLYIQLYSVLEQYIIISYKLSTLEMLSFIVSSDRMKFLINGLSWFFNMNDHF